MPNVAFVKPELKNVLPMYYLIRDAILGEVAIKGAKTVYLPMPNAADKSKENQARYEAYLKRAVFYNVTRRTLLGLIGQVFMREPVIKASSLLNPLLANATGGGMTLTQLAKKTVGMTLAFSRAGLFVDYPETLGTAGATVADLESGKVRPTLALYSAWEIINWRTVDVGAEEILSLVVIFETFPIASDLFETMFCPQFRVLYLDVNGEYVHEIWREAQPTKSDGKKMPTGTFQKHLTFKPTDANGIRLKEIPFKFIGSENNDPEIDDPCFYDLASLNCAHYRNSADYEESCFIVGQPTVVTTGLTEEWVKNVLKGSVDFGSRGGIPLPEGADAKLLQASPNTMIKEAMDTKERQMVALGAMLVEQKEVQRTATEAKQESASKNSTLGSVAKNVGDAFEWALKWASRLIGQPDSGVEFKLNVDFDISKFSTEERQELIKEWQAGAITFEEMRFGLHKAGTAIEDDAAAKTKITQDKTEKMKLEASANSQNPNSKE